MGTHHGNHLMEAELDERRRKIAENQKKAEDSFDKVIAEVVKDEAAAKTDKTR